MNNVYVNDNARRRLFNGVNLITEAVKTTYGPNGKNVVIKQGPSVHVTKDGMTVATYVKSKDDVEQIAIDLVKQAAQKTAREVGDGTTTTVLLTNAIVNTFKYSNDNPIEIQRKLQSVQKSIINILKDNRKLIDSFEDIKKVATISANNDEKLGSLIAEAYNKVGKYGIVNIGESTQVEDSYEISEGLQIESGYASPFFINTDENTCILDNVLVYITQDTIKDDKKVVEIAQEAKRQGKSLLLIATKLEGNAQQFLLTNKQAGILESCYVKTPYHGIYKDTMIDDVKSILGSSMTCEKVIVTKDNTTLIGCKSDIDNTERINSIKNVLKNPELSDMEQKFHTQRLSSFVGGVCTIKVGGYSEAEIKEKKDRVEDAICATKAAIEEGVLPGGGLALVRAYNLLNKKDIFLGLYDILYTPYNILNENYGTFFDFFFRDKNKNFWQGKNLKTKQKGDLYKLGVIEPFLVTKTALENAISTASLILTNECSIVFNN